MSILTTRGAIPTPLHPGRALYRSPDYQSRHVTGAAPTPQIQRLTLSGTAAGDVTVSAIVGNETRAVTATFAGSVDATNTGVLLAALEDDPILAGLFASIASNTSTTIDLTGYRTIEAQITVTGTGLTVAEHQAAAASPTLLYGHVYPIGSRSFDGETGGTLAATQTELAGPVITLTATHDDAADDYDIAAILQGPDGRLVTVSESDSVGADLPAMLAAIDASLTGLVDGATVDSTSSPDVVWSLPVGWSVASLSTSATNSSDLTNAIVAGDEAPEDVGIALNPMNDEFTGFDGGYAAGREASRGVSLVTQGAAMSTPLASGTTVSDGDPVWVETDPASYGQCYPTPAPSRYQLIGAAFVAPSSDALGVVEV